MNNNCPDRPNGPPRHTNEMRTQKNMGSTTPRSRSVHITVPPEHKEALKVLAQLAGYSKVSTFMERLAARGLEEWLLGNMSAKSFADVVEDALERHAKTAEYAIARESVLRAEDRLKGRWRGVPNHRDQEDGDGIEDVG